MFAPQEPKRLFDIDFPCDSTIDLLNINEMMKDEGKQNSLV